ncbi:MAG: hypothetical protein ABSH21_00675 [Verrucomicrobiia bacterium]|jgi:hypothetical protein
MPNTLKVFSSSRIVQGSWKYLLAISATSLCLATALFNAFAGDVGTPDSLASQTNGLVKPNRNERLVLSKPATQAYRKEALRLLIQEANLVAQELKLPENLPITDTNLVWSFIPPFAGAQFWKAIGMIETRNPAYCASRDNKFCYLERPHQEADRGRVGETDATERVPPVWLRPWQLVHDGLRGNHRIGSDGVTSFAAG